MSNSTLDLGSPSLAKEIEEVMQLRQKVAALGKLENLRSQNGLSFYAPHKKQHIFHSYGDWKYRYVRTGNRFGKSDLGAAEDIAWAVGARIWLSPDDPDYQKGIPSRPVKLLIVTVDWDKSTEIFTNLEQGRNRGKLLKFCPSARVVNTHKNHSGAIDQLVIKSIHGGNSVIHLDTVKSFLMNPLSQESGNWDAIHIDEPIPEAMWKAISRGLVDTGGSSWWTCTPLTEPWMNDFFIPSMQTPLNEDDATEFGIKKKKVVIIGSMKDNPYLNPEDIKDFEDTLTEEEKTCRIEGKPLSASGMIYKQFNYNKHIYNEPPHGWNDINDPPKDYTIRYAVDPHPKTPHAVLFAATSPLGKVYFYSETFANPTISGLCEIIKENIKGRFVARAIIDPIAYIKDPETRRCWADVFMEKGLSIGKATKDLAHGIRMVQQALSENNHLRFGCHLARTKWEFERYVWDLNKPDKPRDRDDHMMENLYRLVLTGLDYIAPEKDSDRQYPQTQVGYVDVGGDGRFAERAKSATFDLEQRHPRG